MGVHIPLSLKAKSEARTLMVSSNNCVSPATGQPNILPTQDMILGCYFLTVENTSLYYILNKILWLYNKIIELKQILLKFIRKILTKVLSKLKN